MFDVANQPLGNCNGGLCLTCDVFGKRLGHPRNTADNLLFGGVQRVTGFPNGALQVDMNMGVVVMRRGRSLRGTGALRRRRSARRTALRRTALRRTALRRTALRRTTLRRTALRRTAL